MRGGGPSAALREIAERANPTARLIVETVNRIREDVHVSYADFATGADSYTGLEVLKEGGVRLLDASPSSRAEYTSGTDNVVTTLQGLTATAGVAYVEWSANNVQAAELRQLTARLQPNTGAGKEVTTWVAQLFRVDEVVAANAIDLLPERWTLQPLTQPIPVAADVPGVTDVPFNFDRSVQIGPPPRFVGSPGNTTLSGKPVTVVAISALKANGELASNVAWVGNSAVTTATSGTHTLGRINLGNSENARTSQYITEREKVDTLGGLPRFALKGGTYTAATIEWNTNPLDMGASPTNTVEFVAEGREPSDSSITYQVRNDADSAWITYTDGQTSDDLAGVGKNQTYKMRATLTPSGDTFATPVLTRIGAREVVREVVDGLAAVGDATYSVDPLTLKAEIPQVQVSALRDGVLDYRDYWTEKLSDNHIGSVELRFWYGSTTIARSNWLHLDDFEIHNVESAGAGINIVGVHPIAKVRQTIPVPSTGGTRAALTYGSTSTLAGVYTDILDQIGLAARYRHPIADSTDFSTSNVYRELRDPRPALDELDRIAFLAGGANVPSQGTVKFVEFFGSTEDGLYLGRGEQPEIFALGEVKPISVSPGYNYRVVDYRVPFGWGDSLRNGQGAFTGTAVAQSTAAISKLGTALLDASEELDPETAKWILNDSTTGSPSSTLGGRVAKRTRNVLQSGLITIEFESASYPRPWLEPGDIVAVPTDRFVGRSVETDRALRGKMWAIGPLVKTDLHGRQFTVWVQDPDQALTTATNAEHSGYVYPDLTEGEISFDPLTGIPFAHITGNPDVGSVKIAYSTGVSAFPSAATVRATTDVIATSTASGLAEITWNNSSFPSGGFDIGQTVKVSALGYETSTGGGAESRLYQFKKVRQAGGLIPSLKVTAFRASTVATVSATIKDQSLSMVGAAAGSTSYAIRYQLRNGGSTLGAWTSWTGGSGTPGTDKVMTRTQTVDVPPGLDAEFAWKILYTDVNGTARLKSDAFSLSNLESVTKTLRIPGAHLAAQGFDASMLADGSVVGFVTGSTATRDYLGAVVMPDGVQVTGINARMYRPSTGDTAQLLFREANSTGGITTTHATLTHSGTGFATSTGTFTETIDNTNSHYSLTASLRSTQSAGARLVYADINYTVPDYSKTY